MYHLAFQIGDWFQGYAASIGWIGAATMLLVVAVLFYIFRNQD
jgi:multiple sugar transport system permease protein